MNPFKLGDKVILNNPHHLDKTMFDKIFTVAEVDGNSIRLQEQYPDPFNAYGSHYFKFAVPPDSEFLIAMRSHERMIDI